MANWMFRLGEEYLSVLYDHLHSLLYSYHVIQADQTPVLVNQDGRSAGSKSYMWVYRSGHMYPEKQIILYEYQRTRNASHPREFLKDYSGICVTDGYQVYHTLEKEREDLIIAGCWVLARRRFDEALAVVPKESQKESASFLIIKQIQAIPLGFSDRRGCSDGQQCIRACDARILCRHEKLADDRYHQWCKIIRYHLQHCRNSKSEPFKAI